MKKIIAILPTVLIMVLCTGCSYDKLPPKTDDAARNYVLPKGEVPTADETAEVAAAKKEYEESIR